MLVPKDYTEILTENVQFFFVISKKFVLFEWKKKFTDKNFQLMVDLIKTNTYNDGFFRLNDGTVKVLYRDIHDPAPCRPRE